MKRHPFFKTYNEDPLASEEERMRDEDAYDRAQDDAGDREGDDKAEEYCIDCDTIRVCKSYGCIYK